MDSTFDKFKWFFINSDPCFQPVGITNGLVNKGKDLVLSRVSGSCNYVSLVWGEFDTSMTIKGIAIRSTKTKPTLKTLPMDYAYINANPWMRVKQSSKENSRNFIKVSKLMILFFFQLQILNYFDSHIILKQI